MGKIFTTAAVLNVVFLAALPAMGAVQYTVEDLGNFVPTGINDSGDVAGWRNVVTSGPEHAVLYSNALIDLQTLGGLNSRAFDVNNSGLVVGQSQISDGTYHAFISQNGPMIDLNSIVNDCAGLTLNVACAVNNKGQIAGICTTSGGQQQVFLYDNGSLSTYYVPGMDNVTGLNDNGLIIGNYCAQSNIVHGFVLNDGILTDIDSKQGNITNVDGINWSGTVIGSFTAQNGNLQAFFYGNGILTDINNDNIYSTANGINDNGDIVGGASPDHQNFIYKDGNMANLNLLVDTQSDITINAVGINNKGEILASGFYNADLSGLGHVFVLVPVPEPSVVLLLFFGLVCLFLRKVLFLGSLNGDAASFSMTHVLNCPWSAFSAEGM